MKRLLALVMLTTLAGCTDPKGAQETVEAMGMHDIRIGGYAVLGCGRDDSQATEFSATNFNGQRVEGVVCGNAFFGKYDTVRIKRVIGAAHKED